MSDNMQISIDGKTWLPMQCANVDNKIIGKCIVIHGNFIVILLSDAVLSFETTESEYFKLFEDYEIHPDSYQFIQRFNET